MANGRKKTRRTGQGTVYQRKDGRWEGAIAHGYNEKGNPKRHRVIKPTQAEAVQALNDIIVKLSLGVPIQEEKQAVGHFLDYWLKEVVSGKAPKTVRYYEQMVRLYLKPTIGHIQLSKLSAQHVQALLNKYRDQKLSARTVGAIRATLRTALNTAWRWNLIRENPALRVTSPRIERNEPVYLTPDEAGALLDKAGDHYTARLIELALLTGLRIGEASGLRWEDVDFESNVIRVRKQLQRVDGKLQLRDLKSSSSRRVLALGKAGMECLSKQRAQQLIWSTSRDEEEGAFNPLNLCFTGTDGKPLDPKTVDKFLKRFTGQAKIEKPISFHKLRHTVATHMAASGIPLQIVKDQLGHSQISLTSNTYAHAVPTVLRSAAEQLEEIMSKGKPSSGAM